MRNGLPFYGRHDLLEQLTSHLNAVKQRGTGRMLSMRGRRQVGKSTLLEHFVQTSNTPYVYTTGTFQAPLQQQLQAASQAFREAHNPVHSAELITSEAAQSWDGWFNIIAMAAQQEPIIVVLDEFPWLTHSDPALEGTLQNKWDKVLEHLPVLLILVGSDVHTIDQLGTHGRPLFGRVRPLVVPPLHLGDIQQALPRASATEVFDAAIVTGGYPRLVRELAEHAGSVTEFVVASLEDPYSPLLTTARFTLEAEFPSPVMAYQVLSAIGAQESARPTFLDILSHYGDPVERKNVETGIVRALATLKDEKRLVVREQPVWAPPNSKLRRWRIADAYLRFWFRYCEPALSFISRGRADVAIEFFERDWPSWRGRTIEPLIRESLAKHLARTSEFRDVVTVGTWWNRTGTTEVDIVAASLDKTRLLGTIKWGPGRAVQPAEIQVLAESKSIVPHAEQAVLAAISPEASADVPAGVLTFTAEQLASAWDT